jgi:hypothetical protein
MAESPQLEQQIADLERALAEKRQELGGASSEQAPTDQELVHQHVGEKIQQQMPSYQPTPTPTSSDDSDDSSDGTSSWQDPAIAQQVQALVTTAFAKSLDDAIGEAVKTGNAALIDAFHDLVRDRLISELVARGKFKPVS